MTSLASEPGSNGQQSPIAYQAVIQTKHATLGLVFWGVVTSDGIGYLGTPSSASRQRDTSRSMSSSRLSGDGRRTW